MTLTDWLSARHPAPPAALHDRMLVVASAAETAATDNVAGARAAALQLAATLLSTSNTSRAQALDLLVADALITYSCEAACDDPQTLVVRSEESVASIVEVYERARDAKGPD